jgi:hypothetical protein
MQEQTARCSQKPRLMVEGNLFLYPHIHSISIRKPNGPLCVGPLHGPPPSWVPQLGFLLQEREDALASFTPVKELIEPETSWLALKLTNVGTKYQLLPRA